MFSLRFREAMAGTYFLFDDPFEDRNAAFEAEVRGDVAHLLGLGDLARNGTAALTGAVTLEGMATSQPLEGSVGFFFDQRRFRYEFSFHADDGTPRALRGQTTHSWLAPGDSATLLVASLYDADDREMGRARFRLDLRKDARKLLSSVRFGLRGG